MSSLGTLRRVRRRDRLAVVEGWVRLAGGLAALVTLVALLVGLAQSLRRPKGRATGQARRVLRWPAYLLGSLLYFTLCFVLWQPLPLSLSEPVRAVALTVGSLLYFPGLGLTLWGRLVLGRMYNVSTSLGAELYADQRLVTNGPFALVRHPMYLGLMLAAAGGLLLYRTWTFVFMLLHSPGFALRARREEEALSAEFGEEWAAYQRQVPAWLPRCPYLDRLFHSK